MKYFFHIESLLTPKVLPSSANEYGYCFYKFGLNLTRKPTNPKLMRV